MHDNGEGEEKRRKGVMDGSGILKHTDARRKKVAAKVL
jgi:hypothetical protein